MFPRQQLNIAKIEDFHMRSVRCELLLLEAGSWGRGQFGNPEEGERPPLEAAQLETARKQWQ
jgi:hypothetical protein